MEQSKRPVSLSVVIPLPVAGVVVMLFFMPWLNVSCETKEAMKAMQAQGEFGLSSVPIPFESQEIAHASGWDLAGGKIAIKSPVQGGEGPLAEQPKTLKQRPWLYLCLAGPVVVLLLSIAAISGNVSTSGAGKGMMLFGVIGVVLMIMASTIDYIDDALDQAKDQAPKCCSMPPGCGFNPSMQQAKDEMKAFIKTETTPYLWISLGLHSLTVLCGLGACGAPKDYGTMHEGSFRGDIATSSSPIIPDGPAGIPSFGPDLNARHPRPGTPATTETQTESPRTEPGAQSDLLLYPRESQDGLSNTQRSDFRRDPEEAGGS